MTRVSSAIKTVVFVDSRGHSGSLLGWNNSGNDLRRFPRNLREWLLKALGILLTGIVVSFCASVWFDVLKRFMLVRSAVKPAKERDRLFPRAKAIAFAYWMSVLLGRCALDLDLC
jgi:hypothetical protein